MVDATSLLPLISVIVPCLDEAANLTELHRRLAEAFPLDGGIVAEFVIVDDGSTDDSAQILERLAVEDARVVALHRATRGGQTRALWDGLEVARGEWIAHLDGDLQNDPADLPQLFADARRSGLDAVFGYRAKRHDDFGRRFASGFARFVRQSVLHDSIRDIGCSTRVVRRQVLLRLPAVENQHRYLPALIESGGWSWSQRPVHHHPRSRGRSKYGNFDRALAGLRDLPRVAAVMRAMRRYEFERGTT